MGSKDTLFSLNREELLLLSDPSFFIKKKQVTQRIIDLFGILESEYDGIRQKYENILPVALLRRRGKISRGENYRGLPYVILDYPATFEKKGVFAFRTLMWWGHPFSFTFHLSGCYFDQYFEKLYADLDKSDPQMFICINENQWEHHQEQGNYMPLQTFLDSNDNTPDYFLTKSFLKLAKTVSLEDNYLVGDSGINFIETILNKLK